MRKQDRPIPYPFGPVRTAFANKLMQHHGFTKEQALNLIKHINENARNTPLPGEKCGARTREGNPCKAPARSNGRCRNHGGLSTGARTAEGRKRAYGLCVHGE